MLARLAQSPASSLSQVFAGFPAELQAAYDFVEHDSLPAGGLVEALASASVARAATLPFAFVPLDATSLTLAEDGEHNDFGPIGRHSKPGRGVHLLNGIVVCPKGVPLGLCAQVPWVRAAKPSKVPHAKRALDKKETRYWLEAVAQTMHAFAQSSSATKPWFQLDRGGDAWPLLQAACDAAPDAYFTVRASANRQLVSDREAGDETEVGGKLWAALEALPPWVLYDLAVPAGPARKGRTAKMTLRAREVTLQLRDRAKGTKTSARVWAVWVREQEVSVPAGEKPIEWMLLTTHPVETPEQACLVVFGYAQRWRIEQFHKALKSGGCHAEEMTLKEQVHVARWVALLSAVAMRMVRMSYLARVSPERRASEELSEAEERAICVSMDWERPRGGLTMGQAVVGLATLGGYTGKEWGSEPGFLVIGRGLKVIASLAKALAQGRVVEAEGP
jgi:hypothetical protein